MKFKNEWERIRKNKLLAFLEALAFISGIAFVVYINAVVIRYLPDLGSLLWEIVVVLMLLLVDAGIMGLTLSGIWKHYSG